MESPQSKNNDCLKFFTWSIQPPLFFTLMTFRFYLHSSSNQHHLLEYINKASRSRCSNFNRCKSLTNWKCSVCDDFFCFTSNNNCFADKHAFSQHIPTKQRRIRCSFPGCKDTKPSHLTEVYCNDCGRSLCLQAARNCFQLHHEGWPTVFGIFAWFRQESSDFWSKFFPCIRSSCTWQISWFLNIFQNLLIFKKKI